MVFLLPGFRSLLIAGPVFNAGKVIMCIQKYDSVIHTVSIFFFLKHETYNPTTDLISLAQKYIEVRSRTAAGKKTNKKTHSFPINLVIVVYIQIKTEEKDNIQL